MNRPNGFVEVKKGVCKEGDFIESRGGKYKAWALVIVQKIRGDRPQLGVVEG
jgi:hypothetical protein